MARGVHVSAPACSFEEHSVESKQNKLVACALQQNQISESSALRWGYRCSARPVASLKNQPRAPQSHTRECCEGTRVSWNEKIT
jgi:hypothetical protein